MIDLDSEQITPSEDKSTTIGHEYYEIPNPAATGILSGYGTLNMLLTRLLIDNRASTTATSYLFNEGGGAGYRLVFSRDEATRGFWCYREGQVDHYTVIDALLSIEPIQVGINSL
jgi:hypothetical protein